MKNYFIILGLAIVFLGTGHGVFAQTATPCVPGQDGYCALSPLPGVSDVTGKTNLNTYIKGMFQLAIGLAGVLAVLRIITGGITYMTTEAFEGKSDAKDTIRDAIVGLLLAISAYTILATVNPKLVNFEFGIEGLRLGPPISSNGGTGVVAGPSAGKVWGDSGGDSIDRNHLKNVGIIFNNFNCVRVGDTGCTSVLDIGPTVINGLETLKKSCGSCTVRITGGTEYWLHGNRSTEIDKNPTAHKPGGNVVDLSLDPALQAFLKKNGAPTTNSGCAPGDEKYVYNNDTYVKETPNLDHWHVCFR